MNDFPMPSFTSFTEAILRIILYIYARDSGGFEFKLFIVVTSSFMKILIVFLSFLISLILLSHSCFLGLPPKKITCSLVLVAGLALEESETNILTHYL